MRAAILRAPGDLGVETVPDPAVEQPTDAVVRVVAAAICGTDLRGFAGRLDPSPVFDRVVSLDAVATGYQAMRDREATKVLVRP